MHDKVNKEKTRFYLNKKTLGEILFSGSTLFISFYLFPWVFQQHSDRCNKEKGVGNITMDAINLIVELERFGTRARS